MRRRTIATIAFVVMLAVALPAAARDGGGGGGGGGKGGGGGGGGGGRGGGSPSLSFPGAGGGSFKQGGGGRGGGGGKGGWHGGHGHHHHGGSRFYYYGGYGPWWYPGWGWYRPYYYSYWYPYYPYSYWYPYYPAYSYPSYPAPWSREPEYPDDDVARADTPRSDDVEPASYGLLKLEGVRDGASVDLDGRFWLTADDLDDRWMALPKGEHRIAVRVDEGTPMERTIRIVPGRTHVLKFDKRDGGT